MNRVLSVAVTAGALVLAGACTPIGEAKAAEHQRFAQAYAGQIDSPRVKLNQPQHGRNLAAKYREAAAENLELAKAHHQLAEAAPR